MDWLTILLLLVWLVCSLLSGVVWALGHRKPPCPCGTHHPRIDVSIKPAEYQRSRYTPEPKQAIPSTVRVIKKY